MVRYSAKAAQDLDEIAEFTRRTWGDEQAIRYLEGLEDICRQLEAHPLMGRAYRSKLPGLRRLEHSSHVVFYRIDGEDIYVGRILHKRRLPKIQGL